MSSSRTTGEIFVDFCNESSLLQHIDQPTHKAGSILDLLLCDESSFSNVSSLKILPPLSSTCDHNIINFSLYFENESLHQNKNRTYYSYNKGNYNAINSELLNINWEEVMSNMNFNAQKIYDYFVNKMKSLMKLHIPLSRYNPSVKQPQHITKLAKQKKSLYRKLKTDPSLRNQYKSLSLKYDKSVSNWREKTESMICESGNTTSFYKYTNKRMKFTT